MIRFLTLLLILSASAFALPPIEGGKDAPLETFDYIDFVRLALPAQAECSATRVSPTMILTAAHCVTKYENGKLVDRIVAGGFLSGQGKIVKVSVHPKYLAAKIAKLKTKTTLYDIAFIEVEEKPSKRTMAYPSIISSATKLPPRKKMEMAGHGNHQAFWNGKEYEYRDTKNGLQVATNEWEECPLDYFGNQVAALSKFNASLEEHMKVSAKRYHTIQNGAETIQNDKDGMVLPGDSGSPSIEKDVNGKMVITGVASNIQAYANDSDDAQLEILVDGKVVSSEKLKAMPENWGYKFKSDSEFPVIQEKLKALGLEGQTNVVIKRKYTRITEGNYSDLSHPDNQKFIQSILKN